MQTEISLYQKAVNILTSQGKFHINLGLERVKNLLDIYGNPQDKIKCIHVAGTNGKGSTCAIISAILSEAGYKTGLYTSPHLVDYTERVKINGKDISKDDFADLIFDIIQTAENNDIQATEFEILTVLAFLCFYEKKVDFAVIETGLGGRLDATNVIKNPVVSVITNIDLDHVDRLGDTIEKIASEKAGIIKPNVPVITMKNNKGLEILKEKAFHENSELILSEEKISSTDYELNLKGLWQRKNLSLALKTIDILRQNKAVIPETAVKRALQNVSWPARFQYFEKMNLILDGAHNPDAAKLLRESLDFYYPDRKRIWIYSSISTKNYEEVMKILFNPDDMVILTQSNSGAAVSADILYQAALMQGSMSCEKIYTTKNIKEAINIYLQLINDQCIGIMAGSLYSAGDFLREYF